MDLRVEVDLQRIIIRRAERPSSTALTLQNKRIRSLERKIYWLTTKNRVLKRKLELSCCRRSL